MFENSIILWFFFIQFSFFRQANFLYSQSWLPCLYFAGACTFGSFGRQLALVSLVNNFIRNNHLYFECYLTIMEIMMVVRCHNKKIDLIISFNAFTNVFNIFLV